MKQINVIGAGLAGCEAAYYAANKGIKVNLYEMKPNKKTPAHKNDNFAELVCSNSLKASRIDSAAGLLKEEMRRFGSLCLEAADSCSVAAGGALAVDRELFAKYITDKIINHPNITVINEVVNEIKSIDKKAFISVSTAMSVYGEGFEEVKTGLKIKKTNQTEEGVVCQEAES